MYLNNRLALPVNSSPVMVFPKQTFRDQRDALRYVCAGRLLHLFARVEFGNFIHLSSVALMEDNGANGDNRKRVRDQRQILLTNKQRKQHFQDPM